MSGEKKVRKLRTRFAKSSSKMCVAEINGFGLTETIASVLRRRYGEGHGAAKRLARDCEFTTATARNLLEGRHSPSALHLVRLIAEIDELFDEICRLSGRGEVAETERLFRDLQDIEEILNRSRSG